MAISLSFSARPRTSAAKLKADTTLVNRLRNAVEASSDDDGWTGLANVGHIITKQRPDFDSRSYGYAKLSELMTATTLFELDRRPLGDGKPAVIYARDRRHRDERPKPPPTGSARRADDAPVADALDDGVLGGSGAQRADAGAEGGESG
ncbi:OST-HTH/LOTUS domain-containing protein [Streptosporangium canum]|uniref:OST-HTH/LOTUS domain-containing protein n=1 Tax=Streptosporangium canum TaxID=324952 RepID=UPI003688EDAC